MKALRLGMTFVAGASLLAGMAACSNPTAGGASRSDDKRRRQRHRQGRAIAAMVPEDIRPKGSFTVSINPDIAPIKYVDANGKLAGLVPDLLTARRRRYGLGRQLGERHLRRHDSGH